MINERRHSHWKANEYIVEIHRQEPSFGQDRRCGFLDRAHHDRSATWGKACSYNTDSFGGKRAQLDAKLGRLVSWDLPTSWSTSHLDAAETEDPRL